MIPHHVPLVLHPVEAEEGEDPVECGADVGRARRRADVGLAELQPARAVRPGGELDHLLRYVHPEHRVEPADTAAVRGSCTTSDTSTPSTEWNLPTQPSRGHLQYVHPEHRVEPADTAAVRGICTTSDTSTPSTEWNLSADEHGEQGEHGEYTTHNNITR